MLTSSQSEETSMSIRTLQSTMPSVALIFLAVLFFAVGIVMVLYARGEVSAAEQLLQQVGTDDFAPRSDVMTIVPGPPDQLAECLDALPEVAESLKSNWFYSPAYGRYTRVPTSDFPAFVFFDLELKASSGELAWSPDNTRLTVSAMIGAEEFARELHQRIGSECPEHEFELELTMPESMSP